MATAFLFVTHDKATGDICEDMYEAPCNRAGYSFGREMARRGCPEGAEVSLYLVEYHDAGDAATHTDTGLIVCSR